MVTSSATQHLNRFLNFTTVRLWNSSIREAVSHGHSNKALLLFCQMKQNGFKPDNFTFLFVAKACSELSCFGYSKVIHNQVMKSRFRSDVFVLTAVVDMYVKCNELGHAHKVFERIPVRDTAAWNSMIVGFSHLGSVGRVLSLFGQMRLEGIRPDSVTVMGLTRSASQTKNVGLLKAVHSIAIRTGLDGDVSVANTWIGSYAKCDCLEFSELVFGEIGSTSRTLVSWNSMIEAYSKFENGVDVLDCYKRMLRGTFRPDSSTVVSLLSSCSRPESLLLGASIHCHAVRIGSDSDFSAANTLVSMYSKCGDIISARRSFDMIRRKTRVSWNVVIGSYAERHDFDEAIGMLRAMESAGERPDSLTLLPIVSACGRAGALELGKWIDDYALSRDLRDDAVVRNSLIDMYAKCGSLSDAIELFRAMPEKSVVSWTAMISGCALNGKPDEAIELFDAMVESGIEPNRITFLSVLQACAHAGLLEKGVEFFDTMKNVYDQKPELEHYSCLVDLFGRKGKTEEALELVLSMPVKPDAGIWSSLLSSCKIHRNVEIAENVSRRLFESEPMVAVSYVEMANIYASCRDWDGVAAIRKLMKCNNAKKSPGQSVVVVDGKSKVFSSEDYDHPEVFSICAMLNSLMLQMNEEKHSAQSLEYELA